jgi:hypothetical protein
LKALFFFHPAVWWIERRLTLEREMACDHFVLTQTENPEAYAECLVSLAEKSFLRRGLAMAQAMVGRVRQTSLRVAEILNGQHLGHSRGWKPGLAIGALLVVASAGEISRLPELVSFQDETPLTASVPAPAQVVIALPFRPTLASYSPAKHNTVSFTAKVHSQKSPSLNAKTEVEPTLARLDVNSIAPVPMVPAPIFVVMRTEQFGPSGEFFWSVQIYKLTVFHPENPPAQKENPAKQI